MESKWRHHPCLLGVSEVGGNQNGVSTLSFLLSPVLRRNQQSNKTCAFSRSPNWGGIRGGIKAVNITPTLSRFPKSGEK